MDPCVQAIQAQGFGGAEGQTSDRARGSGSALSAIDVLQAVQCLIALGLLREVKPFLSSYTARIKYVPSYNAKIGIHYVLQC